MKQRAASLRQPTELVADARVRQLRSADTRTLAVSRTRSSFGDRTFAAAAGPQVWNSLPPNLRQCGLSYGHFRRLLKTRNGPKFKFFSNFWPILWNPFAKVDGSMPECAQVCALHMRLQSTALGDAKENRNGRRLSPYRRKPQNWYYVTHFLAHPVESRDRWVQTHATVG